MGDHKAIFQHRCNLSMHDEKVGTKMRKCFTTVFGVSNHDGRAQRLFKSQHAIRKERERHLTKYCYLVHPFSEFRQGWDAFMIFGYLFILFVFPVFDCFICPSPYKSMHGTWVIFDVLVCIINLADMIVNSLTGYVDKTNEVVLKPWKIIAHYLGTFFFFDVVLFINIIHIQCYMNFDCDFCAWISFIRVVKYARLITVHEYVVHVAERIGVSEMLVEAGCLVLFCFYVAHASGCYEYLASLLVVRFEPTWIVRENVMPRDKILTKYLFAIFRSSMALLSVGYGISPPNSQTDQIMIEIIGLVGAILYILAVGKALQWTYILTSAAAKYDEMIQQLRAYMRNRQMPVALQKRLVDFYEFRFQKAFFNEGEILRSLSSQLRQEIVLHSCRRLVENVSFFHNLPIALLLRIVVCMRADIFLANDVVVKAGGKGDSMFFITSGTVAIYTLTGKEVCHLEDGAHFGEIALVMEQHRVASVVAVESCEIYRLDRDEFKRAIAPYPDLLNRIERIAEERYERTVQLDEKNRRDMRSRATRNR